MEENITVRKSKKKKHNSITEHEDIEVIPEVTKPKKKKNKHDLPRPIEENGIDPEIPQIKKKKKVKVEPPPIEEEVAVELPEIDHFVNEKLHENAKEVVEDSWTKEDDMELIRRMEDQCPKNDHISFTARSEKLDWEQIKFGHHSADDCYERWRLMRSKVRHYRLLSEILQDAKVWAQSPWTTLTKRKTTRHPEMPTRPLTSFMLYYMDKKDKVIKRHPELRLTEISRMIAEKYKALSDEKKEYYLEMARQSQEEYRENLEKFYEKYPDQNPKTKKQLTKSNKPLQPVKLYLREKLKKHQNDENFNLVDFTEKYKDVWKNLSMKRKAYWIRLAKEEEERYLQLHEEDLHDGDKADGKPLVKSVISKEENAILDRLAGKPEKPPNSAYSLFSRLMLQDKEHHFLDSDPKKRMKEIALMWKEVPEEQKKAYAEKVVHMHENYKLEFANYLETLPEEKRAQELMKLQPKPKKRRKLKELATKKPKKITAAADTPSGEFLFKNEPEKPPVTAWDLFKTEFVSKNGHLAGEAAYAQAANEWKNLSKKETEKYKKKHQQLKEKYMADFEAFLKTLTEKELKEYSTHKKARFGEDSLDDESSSDEAVSASSNSSEESDSGVSEEAC